MNMHVLKNQTLKMRNVLSCRAKMTQKEMNTLFTCVGQIVQQEGAQKDGVMAMVIFGAEMSRGKFVMDAEILVPVDRVITAPEGYAFKAHFSLADAVKIRHEGSMLHLQESVDYLMRYIDLNGAVPLTDRQAALPASPMDAASILVDIYAKQS